MSGTDDEDVRRVASEIERYLERHPNAMDTLEGIAKWWISQQRYEEALRTVHMALDYLVTKKEVSRQILSNGESIYKRADTKTKNH